MESLLAQYAGLIGVAAFIAFLINVLKYFGIVQDGQAQTWSAGLNLLFLCALFALNVFVPEIDVSGIDARLVQFVEFAAVVWGYLLQLFGSKLAHEIVKGTAVIGKSYSAKG